jgi:hypothetical protein
MTAMDAEERERSLATLRRDEDFVPKSAESS